MSLNRRAAQRDKNEPEIVAALRTAGATVLHLSIRDAPDLLVGYLGNNFLLEVKQPAGPRGGTKHNHAELSEDQAAWHETWLGRTPVVVRSVAEALAAIGATATSSPQTSAAGAEE
jgi:hypothetical protein